MYNILFSRRVQVENFLRNEEIFNISLQNPTENLELNDYYKHVGKVLYRNTTGYIATFRSQLYFNIRLYLDDNGNLFDETNTFPILLEPVQHEYKDKESLLTLPDALLDALPDALPKTLPKTLPKSLPEPLPEPLQLDSAADSKDVHKAEAKHTAGVKDDDIDRTLGGKRTKKRRRFLKTKRRKIKK